ncbi:BPTI/Kunitz inhibitor domain-containing protein [Meloidogyne graminicola]|uniref:BPTI/Kunitz inhibitor domain-containing protein n=1 Tax=Meloidogyne graminicola TaxID=189291 RepID=A0A8S9ZPE6_9BILA|nr:BPTI/Kunitz inhibitor domain-containing protein [Meloidogyne graminicola]
MKQKNDILKILFLFITLIIRISKSSRCVVSKWRQWSECQGDCEFALRVRNRDVLKPPFPEKDEKTLKLFLRECPQLYQVEQCQLRECVEESPFNKVGINLLNKTKIKEENNTKIKEENPLKENIIEDPFINLNEEKIRLNKTKEIIDILNNDGPFSTRIDFINKKQQKNNRIDCIYPNTACCPISLPIYLFDSIISLFRSLHRGLVTPKLFTLKILFFCIPVKGEQFCRPYKYPFCEDSMERTFAAESECINACFTEQEKTVLPDFRRNGRGSVKIDTNRNFKK